MGFRTSFKKQRDDNYNQTMIFTPPCFNLLKPFIANERVQDGFKFLTGGQVRKNQLRQFITAQTAIGNNSFSKGGRDFRKSRFSGLDQLSGQIVRVHHRYGLGTEQLSRRGFAHANPPG